MRSGPIHRKYFIALLCAAALLTGGCVTKAKRGDRTLLLENTVNGYGRAIRWNEWREAFKYIRLRPDTEETLSPEEPGKQDSLPSDIRVSQYQLHGINSNNELTEAMVVATIAYYRKDSVSVRQLEYVQDWWYDEQSERWFMNGRLPPFCTGKRERDDEC